MIFALGLGILTPQPELYHAYSRVIVCNFYVVILMLDAMIVKNNMILDH